MTAIKGQKKRKCANWCMSVHIYTRNTCACFIYIGTLVTWYFWLIQICFYML